MTAHLIRRVTILGTGLIGGSFALALKKNLTASFPAGTARKPYQARTRGALDEKRLSATLLPR
jgi:prephenate dehydrogenase